MEAVGVVRSASSSCGGFVKPSISLGANRPELLSFSTKFRSSNGLVTNGRLISQPKQSLRRLGLGGRRRSNTTIVRASSSSSSDSPIAPLQLESPVGQLLSQILKSHPHLVPAAVDQQLEQLQTNRDAESQKEEPSSTNGATDLVLYRRIAEVKANDRQKAVEEILYALVVQKFMDADVTLIPTVSSSSNPSGRVDSWPSQEDKLEQLHSQEAFDMIKNHLALILGNRLGDSDSVAQISKLRVGQVYAASVMYGYFLKRVDQRFQLEKAMKILPRGSDNEDSNVVQFMPEELKETDRKEEYARVEQARSDPEASSFPGSVGGGGVADAIKPSRLRNYVMNFDGETLQRYATIRSKEAVSIIEKHTEALFGRPDIVITPQGTIDSSKDELIKISFGGLTRLVLEAVTFGSFLWDVESYVDSRYNFVAS